MYKISDNIINLIMEAMKNWKVELTVGGKILAEVKIKRGIFQGDVLLPLLFVIAMMPHTYILRKCIECYKFTKPQLKYNHLMYMDDINWFAENKKELEILIPTMRIYCQNIETEIGIEKCVILVMKS